MQTDQNNQNFQQFQQIQPSNSYYYPTQYNGGHQIGQSWTPSNHQKFNGISDGPLPLSPLVQQNGKLPLLQAANTAMLMNPYHAPPAEPKRIDENTWAETATAMTGATSDTAFSDNISRFGARFGIANSVGANSGSIVSGAAVALIRNETDDIKHFSCLNFLTILFVSLIFILSILSPVAMIAIARLHFCDLTTFEWNIECWNTTIGVFLKISILIILGYLYSSPQRPFFKKKNFILPKRTKSKLLFIIASLFSFFLNWLFYVKNVIIRKEANIIIPLKHASIFIDCFLFIFTSGIIYETWIYRQQKFIVHVIRSPDGFCKSYFINKMNIQNAAVEILSNYFIDFPVCISQTSYNSKRLKRLTSSVNGKEQAPLSASSRIYEEIENEKKIRKRKMRLLIAIEEAFNNLKKKSLTNSSNKLKDDQASLLGKNDEKSCPTDPYELAQSVFPSLIRPLQKYIRITKQQARHPVDTVLHHLAMCIAYNVSPTVFMQRFLTPNCSVHEDAATASEAVSTAKKTLSDLKASKPKEIPNIPHLPKDMAPGGQQKWTILVEKSLTSPISQGLVFQLKRGTDTSLMCTVNAVPLIKIVEDVVISNKSKKQNSYNKLNGMNHSNDPNTV